MRIFIYALAILLMLSAGCKPSQRVSKKESDAVSQPYKRLITKLENSRVDYNSFESPIYLTARFDDTKYRASGMIKHVRNEGIFISIKKFGFELGRMWITPDSFFVLNRIQREYMAEHINYLEKEYAIHPDFRLLEELIGGHPTIGDYDKRQMSEPEGGFYMLNSATPYEDILLSIWLHDDDLLLAKAFYEDQLDRGIVVEFGDELKDKFHIKRKIQTHNIEDTEVDCEIHFKDPQFDDTRLPTVYIPDHYDRAY